MFGVVLIIGTLLVVLGVLFGWAQGQEAQYLRNRRSAALSAARAPAAARILRQRPHERTTHRYADESGYEDVVLVDEWEILNDHGYRRRYRARRRAPRGMRAQRRAGRTETGRPRFVEAAR